MTARSWRFAALAAASAIALAGCQTARDDTAGGQGTSGTSTGGTSAGGTGTSAGNPTGASGGTGGTAGTGTSIPTLVNVNLQNVLNDLSVAVKVDRANIPVNAQVPIDVAANVCGVSVSALAASIASGQADHTVKTTDARLPQAVQQQVAAGGNVGGGAQTMGGTTNNMM